jgi:hypothetical protein
MREYKVMASSMHGTYTAGRHVANSSQEACDMAQRAYRNSATGRGLQDAGAYRFYVVSQFPHESED